MNYNLYISLRGKLSNFLQFLQNLQGSLLFFIIINSRECDKPLPQKLELLKTTLSILLNFSVSERGHPNIEQSWNRQPYILVLAKTLPTFSHPIDPEKNKV